MFCNQCGTPNQDTARFCNGCGCGLIAQAVHQAFRAQSQPEPVSQNFARDESEKKSKPLWPIVTLVFVVGGLIIAVIVIRSGLQYARTRSELNRPPGVVSSLAKTFQPTPPPRPIPHITGVAKTSFTVNARNYTYFEFDIPRNAQNARLTGSFEATGGSGNDVQVIVEDANGFTNFQNGHQFRTPYGTQRITTDTINISMRPGHFYLVFNNKFSFLTPKAVAQTLT